MRLQGFIGPSYTHQSLNVDCQRCVNLFPEMNPTGVSKEGEVASLVPTPGLRLLLTLTSGPVRALHRASNDQVFAVAANKLYRISSTWVATELGTLNTTSGPVSVADNGTHVVIVDGTNAYVWNIDTSSYSTITDPDFEVADQVKFLDGYFIFNRTGTQQWVITGLYDTAFDALDFTSSEGSPDNLVGIEVANRNLYTFGAQSIEVFYNSGDADFPFARIQGAVIDIGCAAAFSIAKTQNTIYWIGGDDSSFGAVYRMSGYQAERVSTPAIESVIRGIALSDLADSRAWVYQQGGHVFYCLNLPGIDSTWVFDASTNLWHERTYNNLWGEERHRAECHTVAHGLNVVGDYENGKLYALDPDVYTDNGAAIRRMRTAPHVSSGLKRLFHHSLQLDIETGVGLTGTGSGSDPKAMLQWSDDGGHSWSNEYWQDIGKLGVRRGRVLWRRLGSSRDRVYRVVISDPVKVVLIGAELSAEEGGA